MAASEVILEAQGLSKEFLGFCAVDAVDLSIRRGSLHALIGPNGAGKTTVFNLLTGFVQPTAGRIRFNGTDITGESPVQIARRGMVRSFQISATFPHLTLLENVRVALQRKMGNSLHFWEHESRLNCLNEQAMRLLEEVDLHGLADRITVELPYGRKRALEIATTLALDPELMLLDEPTQGMGHEDVSRVVELIRKVGRDRTILMVEHNLSVVETLSDVITVLQRGSVLAQGPYATVSKDPRVLEAYVGVEV
ncbi:MAG TPA: ABC transporter ATP-binding protein [Burkholderiaceae bacterium]|nr:ABC transporter ATP-binding protein [Burkholderiaceae bacterium]